MKQRIWWALLSLVLLACERKQEKLFVVKGSISESSARKIYLVKVPANATPPSLEDSAILKSDGKFELGTNDTESVIYNLVLDNSEYPVASVINDTSQILIDIRLRPNSKEFAEDYIITGSPASEKMKRYMMDINKGLINIYAYAMQADSIGRANGSVKTIDSLMELTSLEGERLHDYTLRSIDESDNAALSIFELGYYQSISERTPYGLPLIDGRKTMEILTRTTERFPDHKAAAIIRAETAKAIQDYEARSWVGKEAPDFSLPGVSGNMINLKSFRGKYVLVDFWASWCGPCRAENPNLVQAHEQFRHRNFTILGVSLDKPGQKDKWLRAIQQDNLNWTHVSDLKEWGSPVVPLYRIDGIPFNVLVDPEGRILAENLRGFKLSRTLNEVLPNL